MKILICFIETIKWVNEEVKVAQLPKVAETVSYNHFTLEPKLSIYIRKSNNNKLPFAVGEFKFACTITVFIIPLVKAEESKFLEENDYKKYWIFFKHLSDVNKNWYFKDFSDNERKDFSVKLVAADLPSKKT